MSSMIDLKAFTVPTSMKSDLTVRFHLMVETIKKMFLRVPPAWAVPLTHIASRAAKNNWLSLPTAHPLALNKVLGNEDAIR